MIFIACSPGGCSVHEGEVEGGRNGARQEKVAE